MTMTASEQNDRDARAFGMRAAGYTYRQIAESLGFASTNAADYSVQRFARNNAMPIPGYDLGRAQAARRGATTRYQGPRSLVGARRFGVEIEVTGLRPMAAFRAIRNVVECIDPGHDTNYTHSVGTRWKVVYDASVSGGCEIVSPPLSGPAGFTAIKAVMQALKAAGGRTNSSCGLHVHHEVEDLTGEEMARLIEMYDAHQGTMNSLVSPSRRNNGMARRFEFGEAARFARVFRSAGQGKGAAAKRQVRSQGIGERPESRYRVLNVHSFPTYGTLEFRQHQGTLNAAKTEAWVLLGQAMIEAARAQTTLRQDAMLADLVTAGHLAATTSSFLSERAEVLA